MSKTQHVQMLATDVVKVTVVGSQLCTRSLRNLPRWRRSDADPDTGELTELFTLVETSDEEILGIPPELLADGLAYEDEEMFVYLMVDATAVTDTGDDIMLVSGTHSSVVVRLLEGLVPELADGTIRVMSAARDTGRRTKIAVASTRAGFDPVSTIVGRGGRTVEAVRALLGGERVEVIPWSPVPETLLARAFAPATVTKVSDLAEGNVEVTVPKHMMAVAVGQNGSNALLASRLIGRQNVNGYEQYIKVDVVPT